MLYLEAISKHGATIPCIIKALRHVEAHLFSLLRQARQQGVVYYFVVRCSRDKHS